MKYMYFKTEKDFPQSLPSWERGLKYYMFWGENGEVLVAPLVGAWIEIKMQPMSQTRSAVAPLVGAWIEIK